MPEIYIPFDKALYDDIVRFSDGAIDPAGLADDLVHAWVQNSLEFDYKRGRWGDRDDEVAEKYAPHVLEQWRKNHERTKSERKAKSKPLVWKEVVVAHGTAVRMAYGGEQHYAEVINGKIVDPSGEYSPSEWASKVAEGTARNAWRDLWFKEALSEHWLPAQLLRNQARQAREEAA